MAITLNTKAYAFAGFDSTNQSTYVHRPAGQTTGWSVLSARVIPGTSKTATKVNWKLKLPVIATEEAACKCPGELLRETTVNITVTTAASSTTAELTDISLRVKDLAASPEFLATLASLIQPSS